MARRKWQYKVVGVKGLQLAKARQGLSQRLQLGQRATAPGAAARLWPDTARWPVSHKLCFRLTTDIDFF